MIPILLTLACAALIGAAAGYMFRSAPLYALIIGVPPAAFVGGLIANLTNRRRR